MIVIILLFWYFMLQISDNISQRSQLRTDVVEFRKYVLCHRIHTIIHCEMKKGYLMVLGKMFIISLFICSRFSRQKEMESLVLCRRLLAVTTAAAEGQWAVRVPLHSTPDLESVHQHFLSGGERKPSS